MTSLPRSDSREPLSGRDDHFVGAVEAVGLIDHGKLVDRGDDKGAGALGRARARNHPGEFLAQTRAVEVARQFVACGEIIEPRERRLLFGHEADEAGDPLGAAVCARLPHGTQLEPFARLGRHRFEFEFELGVLRR